MSNKDLFLQDREAEIEGYNCPSPTEAVETKRPAYISKESADSLLGIIAAKDATIAELRAEIARLEGLIPAYADPAKPIFEPQTPALPV